LNHAMPLARGLALDLACGRDLEALLGTALGLHLGHLASFLAARGLERDGAMVYRWLKHGSRHGMPRRAAPRTAPYRVDWRRNARVRAGNPSVARAPSPFAVLRASARIPPWPRSRCPASPCRAAWRRVPYAPSPGL